MKKAMRTSIALVGIMISASLWLSAPSLSFEKILSPALVEVNTTKTEPAPEETTKEVGSYQPGPTGFRSEEFEVGRPSDDVLPFRRTLSTEESELSETTDASGGSMIHLQGRFRSGLEVQPESMEALIGEPPSPARP